MTLVLSGQTRGSLWVVADRRLSWRGRPPTDDAVKIACVETTDGIAIISYAGLGATALGSQPSDWIVRTLRGRRHSLEGALSALATAMQREFLPHLRQFGEMHDRQHIFVAPAFVGGEHRIYTFDMAETPTGVFFRHGHHIRGGALKPMRITVPILVTGTGLPALERDRTWEKALFCLVKAYNRGRLSARVVSTYLAGLCDYAHQHTKDGTVGPSCIVVWRNSKTGRYKGGGDHACYEVGKEVGGVGLPTVARGMDVSAISKLMLEMFLPIMTEDLRSTVRGPEKRNE